MKSESFRKQALSLVLFFAAVAAVFALTRLRSDPAKKQAEFVVQQLLSCSSAVEQAVDAAAPAGSEPGLAAVDTDGLYAFLQAQLGDAMTADCLDKVMANRLPTRITALAGQSGDKLVPADLTLKKRAGTENCYDFSAALLTAADKLGIQYIATGHHARVELGSDGVHAVCPAVDATLDESAALAALPQDTLARLLLPLGEFTAADVQEMAQDFKVNGTV